MRHEMEVYYQFLANAASVCFGRIAIIATSYVRARGSTMFFFHLFSVLEFFVVNLQMYPRWLFFAFVCFGTDRKFAAFLLVVRRT